MPEVLSVEEVLGGAAEIEKPVSTGKVKTLSVEEVTAVAEPAASKTSTGVIPPLNPSPQFLRDNPFDSNNRLVDADQPDPNLPVREQFERFKTRVNKGIGALGTEIRRDLEDASVGLTKAVLGGLAGMGVEMVAGAKGIYEAATGGGVRGAQKVIKETREKGEGFKKSVTGLIVPADGLESKGPAEQKAEQALGLIFDAAQTFSDIVYKSTETAPEPVRQTAAGAAFAVGTAASLGITPGTFKSKGTKVGGKALPKEVETIAVAGETAIVELTLKEPKLADELVVAAKQADPKIGEALAKQVDELKAKTPEEAGVLGEKLAEAGFEKVGETPEGKPRVRPKQEVPKTEPVKPRTPEEQIKANEARIKEIEAQLARDTANQAKVQEGLPRAAMELYQQSKKETPVPETVKAVEKPAPITLDPVYTEAKAIVEANPERSISKLKEELGVGDAKAAKIVEQVQKEKAVEAAVKDPAIYRDDTGQAVTERQAIENFTDPQQASIPLPGADFVIGKMKAYFNEIQRLIAPETLGPGAKMSAALTAKNIAQQMRSDVFYAEKSAGRRTFWEKNTGEIANFVKRFESGNLQKNPVLQAADFAYAKWNKEIYAKEQRLGIKYEPVDNYLYHVFEDGAGVAAFFERKYGPRWNEPGFVKDRSFKMYEAAEAAGFKPKYRNPEDIMLARQHASDVAEMRVQTLKDLKDYGLAKEITKGDKDAPAGWQAVKWKSPNGTKYWVHDHAAQILHNAFETKTLWSVQGIIGDAFRGAMFLKNIMVSTLLSLSGFHALHVLTLDNATNMVRASKESLSGTKSPVRWLGEMIEANLYGSKGIPFKALYDNPAYGGKLIKAYEGKIDPATLSAADRQLMVYMTEGGFIPHLSAQYKTTAIENFKKSIREGSPEGVGKAAFWLPFAALQMLQKPMMEIWIPRLKAASYARDIQTAIKTDPTLLQDTPRRIEAFHKLAKSIDNRYGEMAYNTLFWNRTIKDLGVANTLSLGWQLGFLREYGGGMMDAGQFVKPGSSIKQKVKTGLLDRPLFLTFYTTQSLLYGGLMTYALTGGAPETLEDYIFPKNGEKNPDGTDQRVSTMYYVKEFASIGKRMEIEGVGSGLKHVVESKASGVVGAVGEWVTGLNSMGQEIRDPNAPLYQQTQEALAYTLQRMEPISAKAVREGDRSAKSIAMGVAGFSPAPKYIRETVTEGKIKAAYQKYNTGKQVPYEKYLLSKDRRELERLYETNDLNSYDKKLDEIIEKFQLTEKEQVRLTKNIGNKDDDSSSASATMFKSLPWQKQKALLDQMTEEEREIYLPVSNKDHLRDNYEPPEQKEK